MKYLWSYLTLLILFVVQTTLGRYISIFSIAPNLVLVFAMCYAMYNFPVRSAVLCALSGLLIDLYGHGIVGINALLYMYLGLAVSFFASSLLKKNIWAVALGVAVVSLLYHTAYFVIIYFEQVKVSFIYAFLRIIIPTTVYDGLVSLVIFLWARWLSEEQIRGF
jgi:rod shape-determining protein MreD